jgi:hypothetical protein
MLGRLPPAFALVCFCLLLVPTPAQSADFSLSLKPQEDDVRVEVDGKPFTVYRTTTGPKPILWPVIGPTGAEMTRAFPMKDLPGEKHDHPHQRSIWFTHGDVNGVDFWSENAGHGSIAHREYVSQEVGPKRAVIATRNDWIDSKGKKVCEDRRVLTFSAGTDWRSIDFEITLLASDGPIKFGDTKEGSMGIRIPTVMDVDGGQGGRIVNSEGDTDKAAWGKPASWVDYYGTVDKKAVGIAFMNHPSSFRYPTRWHVREYGLFAANPFGLKDFVGKSDADGSYMLDDGKSITLRYRLLFHLGDATSAKIAEAFQRYAK